MNKIVLEHYPVSKLPDDLREQFAGATKVTVTIEPEKQADEASPSPEKAIGWFARHQHVRRDNYKTSEEINEWVGHLREEWSHRDR